MKWFAAFAIFVWLLCGLVGAWMLEGRHDLHWKAIARGPITLGQGLQRKPDNYPTGHERGRLRSRSSRCRT